MADALIHHPSIAHYLRFAATTVARDKLLRLVQYFARFYSWYLLRTNGTPAQILPWDILKRQFSLARKLLRVGKPLEHLKAAAIASDYKITPSMDPVLRATSVGKQLAYAGYLTFDGLTLLDTLGVKKTEKAKRWAREAYRLWAVGLAFSVVGQCYTLYRLREREARVDRKDGEGVVEGKRIALERSVARTQLLSDACDLTIPTSALGWIGFDDGAVGLAGTLGSIIGIMAQWKKTA